jgi:hypothetical protein
MSIKPFLVPLFPGVTDVTVSFPKLKKLITVVKRTDYTFIFEGGKEFSAVLNYPSDVSLEDLLVHLNKYVMLVPVIPGKLAVDISIVGYVYSIERLNDDIILDCEYKIFDDSGICQKLKISTDVEIMDVATTICRFSPGGKFVKISDNFYYNINRKGLRRIGQIGVAAQADFWVDDLSRVVNRFNELSTDQFVVFNGIALRMSFLRTLHFVKKHGYGVELLFDPKEENLMPGEPAPRRVVFEEVPEDVYHKINQAFLDELREQADAIPLPEDISSEIVAMNQFADFDQDPDQDPDIA